MPKNESSLEEFKKLDVAQLKEREQELRSRLFKLRTESSTEKVKDTSQFKKTKRDIARVLTLVHQKETAKA